MTYTLRLTIAARSDLDEIVSYGRRDSPQAAEAITERFLSALQSLSQFPNRCPVAAESDAWQLEVRCLLVFSYKVFFHVDARESTVTILRILHDSRLPPSEPPPH